MPIKLTPIEVQEILHPHREARIPKSDELLKLTRTQLILCSDLAIEMAKDAELFQLNGSNDIYILYIQFINEIDRQEPNIDAAKRIFNLVIRSVGYENRHENRQRWLLMYAVSDIMDIISSIMHYEPMSQMTNYNRLIYITSKSYAETDLTLAIETLDEVYSITYQVPIGRFTKLWESRCIARSTFIGDVEHPIFS